MSQVQIRGIAKVPHLNDPDTKFDDAGVFKTDLVVAADVAEPLIARFEKMQAAKMDEYQKEKKGKRAKAADLPIQPELDEDGNETGSYIVRVKMKASGISKKTGKAWSRQLPLFDSVGNPTSARVGGGSDIIVAVEPASWSNPKGECSVTLRLEAVQVIRASGGGGRSAGAFGFGAVEGGFVASEDEEAAPAAAPASEDSSSDAADAYGL